MGQPLQFLTEISKARIVEEIESIEEAVSEAKRDPNALERASRKLLELRIAVETRPLV